MKSCTSGQRPTPKSFGAIWLARSCIGFSRSRRCWTRATRGPRPDPRRAFDVVKGWSVDQFHGVPRLAAYGTPDGKRNAFMRFPDRHAVVIVLTADDNADAKGLAERIADRTFLRLIARMLKAGVQTPGGVVYDELGSPQGSIVSPVIANAFLDHVLDQWFVLTVRQHCRGYCALIRYADDALVVFEYEQDAQRFFRPRADGNAVELTHRN